MDTVIEICPYFELLDSFLGSKPLSCPHFRLESSTMDLEEGSEEGDNAETEDIPQAEHQQDAADDNTQDAGHDEIPENDDQSEEPEGTHAKRIHLQTPGSKKRMKKAKNVSADVTQDIHTLVEDSADFISKQEAMWEEHLKLQKEHLKSREEDRKLLEKMLEIQQKENSEMTHMFGELIGLLSQRQQSVTSMQSAHTSGASTDGQNYAGVPGPSYYDMTNNYVQFHNL
jgi:hypothetical protein